MGKDSVSSSRVAPDWENGFEDHLYRLKALAYQFADLNDGLMMFETPADGTAEEANARHHLYVMTVELLHREIEALAAAVYGPSYFGSAPKAIV